MAINKYTRQEATVFLNTEPSYGYHTILYSTGFYIDIKEYRHEVSIDIKFIGQTPSGAAGPHGFGLVVQKTGEWKKEVEGVCQAALNKDFSRFPNPTQYNRSASISNGENSVRSWVADHGSAQSFAEQCFALNEK